jgi:NAD+ kinase
MTNKFQTIGILARRTDPEVGGTLMQLDAFLQKRGHRVLLEAEIAAQFGGWTQEIAPPEEIAKICDLVIVVGGDGTLLRAARSMVGYDVPLLGINLGRLGFLADVSPDIMTETLEQILTGDYDEEERFMLRANIGPTPETANPATALNDVVIHKWNVARMIEYETYVDGRLVNTQRSDGLIIATPTGSTAYALSGGGPLLDPALNALVLVPICPHTLSNRPIVVSGDCKIEIIICGRTKPKQVRVTCDGEISQVATADGRIHIQKHPHRIRLIHPSGHDHFGILRAKLGWSEHPV